MKKRGKKRTEFCTNIHFHSIRGPYAWPFWLSPHPKKMPDIDIRRQIEKRQIVPFGTVLLPFYTVSDRRRIVIFT